MSGVNKAIVIGFLGNDPKVRATPGGGKAAELSVATTESWRDKTTGERKQATEWHRVVIFNEGLVKVAEQYARKGARLYVEGQMKTRKWTDRAGVERYMTEIVLGAFGAQLQLLDRREAAPAADNEAQYGAGSEAPPAHHEDIPF
jgi:single-strand DNA-binding protein